MDTTNNEVFENGYASGKIDGFKEAWKLAQEVFNSDYAESTLKEIFGTYYTDEIFDLSAIEVATRIEEFKKEIKVGDVVKHGKYVGVVLQNDGNIVRILTKASIRSGNTIIMPFPVSTVTKLAEAVESFSDMLGKVAYVDE